VTSRATLESGAPSPAPPPRRGGRWPRVLGLVTGVALAGLVAITVLTWMPHGARNSTKQGPESNVPVAWQRPAVTKTGLVQRSGVTITRVAVTGGGGLVDLRYQVVDPDKADALHNPETPPAIVDENSGLVVHDLFMDHAHSGPYKAGITYYLVFNNPGNWVHHGSSVTVLLGNAQVEHVLVR
jgi:hypothetical protein